MAVENVSVVHNKLIGLNFLSAPEGECVANLWSQRFQERAAFWVNVTEKDNAGTVFSQLCGLISQQNITSMAGEKCIIAVFMDAVVPLSDAWLDILAKVPKQIEMHLGCHVALVYEFVYVGSLAAYDRVAVQSWVKALSAHNNENAAIRRQACLIARPILAVRNLYYWKAAIVTLDLLRRYTSPDAVLPSDGTGGSNDDVGFLRYSEYDRDRMLKLQKKRESIARALGNGGEAELHREMESILLRLSDSIRDEIVVSTSGVPIHPDMFVEGIFKQASARNGNNRKFNAAQRSTQEAVIATGEEIKRQVLALGQAVADQASKCLDGMLDKFVGIELWRNRTLMHQALELNLSRTSATPIVPVLRYNRDGYDQEISAYLQSVLEHAAYQAKECVIKAFKTAYDGISDEAIQKKEQELKLKQDQVNNELKNVPQEAGFCGTVKGFGELLESCFKPAAAGLGGSTKAFLLCQDQATAARLDREYGGPDGKVHLIDGIAAGLKTLDEAPIRGLHILSFNCSDALLENLLP